MVEDFLERGMDRRVLLAFGEQAAQRRQMGHAVYGRGRREETCRAQIEALDCVKPEMLVEPRPPGRAQRIARLQHAAHAPAGAAAHQAEVPAVPARHQFENDAGFAVALDAEHNAFIGPLHGRNVICLSSSEKGDYPETAMRRFLEPPPSRAMTSQSFGNSKPISR